jgi:drug/metabolite transporter (DMT)-like permease
VFLGFSGVVTLVAGNGFVRGEAVNPAGAIVLVIASLAWAGGSIYSRQAPLPTSPLMATAMQMLCGGVALVVGGMLAGEGPRVSLASVSWRSALSLAYLIVFGSLIAFSAYVWLLRVTTPSRVGTYAFVNPVVAVLFGYALGGEQLTPRTLLATAVIVTGVVLITLYGRRAARPGPTPPGVGKVMSFAEAAVAEERVPMAGSSPAIPAKEPRCRPAVACECH